MLPLHTIPLGCQGCGESDAFLDPCHFASCPCGIRASDSLHHPVRDLTADMLKQVFGANRVLVDTEMGDSYTVYSAIKRPDLVVQHALGSGAHLVIDVKTVDGTGSTAIERSHTDVSALGGLTEVERALWDEYTDSGRRPDAIPAGSELICAAVGRHGGIGAGMIELINRCARTRGNAPGAGEHFSEFETFVGVWRHRFSLLVASATSQRIRLNSCSNELAQTLCATRRERSAGSRRRRHPNRRARRAPSPTFTEADDDDDTDDEDEEDDDAGDGAPQHRTRGKDAQPGWNPRLWVPCWRD